jgi:hypothetical protein
VNDTRRRLTKAELDDPQLRELLDEIRGRGGRLRQAEDGAHRERAALRDVLLRGHHAGLGYRRLAKASGVYTPVRVQQIVKGQRL